MIAVFLAVTMLALSPESPVCFQGVIGDGGQRRLIVQMQSETTATAHLYTRPVRHHRNDDRHDRVGFAHGLAASARTYTVQVRRSR